MQIYDQLADDHKKIKALMSEIEAASERVSRSRSDVAREQVLKSLQRLKQDLLAHVKAEEDVFYESLIDDGQTREAALDAIEIHKMSLDAILELEEAEPSDEKWLAKFRALRERLENHIEEEEKNLFRLAKKIVSRDEAEEMAEIFRERRAEVYDEI